MKQLTSRIVSNEQVMPATFLMWIEAPEIAAVARPGQFVTIRCGEGFAPLLRRPLSIHRIDNGRIALLFAVVGQGTEWLSKRGSGDRLDVMGPLGNGFIINADSRKLLLVAGGIGVAPLIGLAEQAVVRGLSVKLLMGAATALQLYPKVIKGVEVVRATDDGSSGEKGRITEMLASNVGWADQIFTCGPIPMYRSMARMGEVLGDKEVQVSMEQVMGCAAGACRGCAVPTVQGIRMACSDGPVFELRQIIWDDVVEPCGNRLTRSV